MADDKLIFDLLTGQNTVIKELSKTKDAATAVEKAIASFSPGLASAVTGIRSLTASFNVLTGSAIAAAGAFVGAKIIKAAEDQEDSIAALNAALRANGNFIKEASDSLVEYADGLEKTTKFSSETVLQNVALLQSLGNFTKDGLIAANDAALNLATTFRIDLDTAARLVAKASEGNLEAFKKQNIAFQQGKDRAETFANALRAVQQATGGSAAAAGGTFAGVTTQAAAGFENVLKAIGNIIIQNPAVISAIKSTGEAFNALADSINSAAGVISPLLTAVIQFGPAFVRFATEALVVVASVRALQLVFSAYKTQLDIIQARQGAGVFAAIITQIKLATAGMRALQIETIAARVALTALKAAATFGLTIVLDLAIRKLIQMTDNVDVFKEGLALAGRAALFLLETLDGVLQSMSSFAQAAAAIPGSSDFVNGVAASIKGLADGSAENVAKLRKAVDGLNKDAEKAAKSARESAAGGAQGPLIDPVKAAREMREASRKVLGQQVGELEKALKNAGETQLSIIAKEAGERAALIQKAERAGAITRERAETLLGKIRLDVLDKVKKAEAEASDARRKKLQESIQIAAQNPLNLAFQDVNIELPGELQTAFSGVFGTLSNISKGAQGAAGLLSGFTGAAANAFARGSGAAAQEVFSLLAQGPAKVKETFDSFFASLPSVLENIIASIPQILISIAENLGPLIDRLAESIPRAVEAFLEKLPEVAVKLSEAMVRAAFALQLRMPAVAAQMAISLTAEMPKAAVSFIDQLVKETPRLITEMIKQIPQAIGGIGGSIGGAAGGLLGGFGGAIGGIGDIFGFASGGGVSLPAGDTLIAGFNADETVINKEQTTRFNRLLDRIEAGALGGGTMQVQLVVGEEQLANVLVDLNRRGFRLA